MASYLHALASRALRQAHVAVPRPGARFEPAPGQAEGTEPIDLQTGRAHEPRVTGRLAEGDARPWVETRFEPPFEPGVQRAASPDERADPLRAPARRLSDADAGLQGPPGSGPHLAAAAPTDRSSPRPSRPVSVAERDDPSPGELGPAPLAAHRPLPPSVARPDDRPDNVARAALADEPALRPETPGPQTTEWHEGSGASSRNDATLANVSPASEVERRSEALRPQPIRPDRPAPTDDAPAVAPAVSAAIASARVASLAVPWAPAQPSIAATTPARRDRHAQAAPSIHVTIGRIEIRNDAAAAAPAVRERPAAAPRSSLQHYLQSRGNGRTA